MSRMSSLGSLLIPLPNFSSERSCFGSRCHTSGVHHFLRDIRSLSAGLNYPPSAPVQPSKNHPANKFADAFLTAQSVAWRRSRLNQAWKLVEFWNDEIVEPMAVIEKVLHPIIESALKKKGEKKSGAGDANLEGETLLSHLVNLTDGKPRFRAFFLLGHLHPKRPQDYPR